MDKHLSDYVYKKLKEDEYLLSYDEKEAIKEELSNLHFSEENEKNLWNSIILLGNACGTLIGLLLRATSKGLQMLNLGDYITFFVCSLIYGFLCSFVGMVLLNNKVLPDNKILKTLILISPSIVCIICMFYSVSSYL